MFADDFSENPGTPIVGKAPDVGNNWTVLPDNTSDPGVSASNTLLTNGAGRALFADFTSILGAGQVITLTYDIGSISFNGFAGISMYDGELERIFTGNPSLDSYGVDNFIPGSKIVSTDVSPVTSVRFTYAYDSGEWTFSTSTGADLAGTGSANVTLDRLRVANNNGGDIEIDNLFVDISAVPEPSSLLLLGLGALAALRRRR